MNLTLSLDEKVVDEAREVARRQGTSLNALIRQYVESLAGRRTGTELAKELQKLWKQASGRSRGRRWRREDAYSGRL